MAAKQAVLKMEVAVLKKLQMCPYACKYVHCGHFDDHNYLVMELLGENLSELRRKMRGGRFSLPTTVRLGVQMIRAVQAIHELGYLHRDIKPSNFAMGLQPGRKEQCVMIDFGLTRKYRLPNGQIRPARDIAGFRGTARYASINSHLSKELSRRDDLWSVLYLLIEFLTGQLPWRKLKDKEEIGLLKIHFNSPELVKDLPPPYLTFMLHLQVRSAASINRAAMLFRMFVCRIDAFVYPARLSTMSTGPTTTFSWGF
jgi:tau tubulin kinase